MILTEGILISYLIKYLIFIHCEMLNFFVFQELHI